MGVFRDQTERVAAFNAACSECRAEVDAGKRDAEEVNPSEGDCVLCETPCCQSHGRNYDTNVVSGWAHEMCKENWREFVEV